MQPDLQVGDYDTRIRGCTKMLVTSMQMIDEHRSRLWSGNEVHLNLQRLAVLAVSVMPRLARRSMYSKHLNYARRDLWCLIDGEIEH